MKYRMVHYVSEDVLTDADGRKAVESILLGKKELHGEDGRRFRVVEGLSVTRADAFLEIEYGINKGGLLVATYEVEPLD